MSDWKDSDEMPFGKYRGEKLGDVPADYLLWLYEQDDFQKNNPALAGYVQKNLAALEREAKEMEK